MCKSCEIFWLIGILEGEGTFAGGDRTPLVRVAMTDKDTVQRAADLMGCEVSIRKGQKPQYKDVFGATITGLAAADLMMKIYPHMSMRRQEKIQSIIVNYSGPGHKLNRADVREIRRIYSAGECTQQILANKYRVAQSLISAIVNRKKWATVQKR